MNIERLPELGTLWRVHEGLSYEWDLIWLVPSDRKIKFFEMCLDSRTDKLKIEIEYEENYQAIRKQKESSN